MDNIKLDNIEETLFVPMRGRVFASENFKDILYDQKALEIADKIPDRYMDYSVESEYTLLASAVRSKNIDILVQNFLERNPKGCIINIGAGLETTYFRNNNNLATWFELDLEEVADLRKTILGENEKDKILAYSMFDYEWIEKVKQEHEGPYLIISSGVFYYFKMEEILNLLNNLNNFDNSVEVIFDCVSKIGIKFTRKHMKNIGKEDATMYFYVDDAETIVKKIDNSKLIECRDYYSKIDNMNNMKLMTKISMKVSDLFHMVKMIHIKIE